MKNAMIAQAFLSRLTPKLAAVVVIGFVLLPGLLVTNASGQATGEPIVPYLSRGYRYLVVPTGGGPAGFEQPGFDDSQFANGDAAFGLGAQEFFGCPLDDTAETFWPLDTDILLRKTFTLPADASNVEVGVAIDNDIQMFINGTDISGGLRPSEGCAFRDQFIFLVPNNLLDFGGTNLLAVRARDRGGDSYVDVEVRATLTSFPVQVTGGGQITLDGGKSASFGFVAQGEEENDPVSDHFNYLDHDTGRHINGPVETITASAPTGLVTFSGTADDGDCTFKVTVEDKAEPGKGVDTFEMESSCDPPVSQRAISRGNIQRHF
jgi:hypothetical protein